MTKVKLINLTPHKVRLMQADGNGESFTIPICHSAGVLACESHLDTLELDCDKRVELIRRRYYKFKGLPPKQKGVLYIVSEKTALLANRDDLVVPVRVRKGRFGRKVAEALAAISIDLPKEEKNGRNDSGH